SQPNGSSRSLIDQYAAPGGTALNTGALSGYLDQRSNEVAGYLSNWQSIANAATSAQSALSSLAASCPSRSNDASTALSSLVQPTLTKASTAQSTAADAQATIAQARADLA